MIKIQYINNFKYKGKWNKLFHLSRNVDFFGRIHLLFGIFNQFIFVTYRNNND